MDQKLVRMLSPKTQLIRRFCLLFCLLFCLIKLQSQCNPPNELPTGECETAPLTCLADACYSTASNPSPPYSGWCGAMTQIHNPQYFQFIATATTVQINIHVDNCTSGSGLQSAILGACPWTNADVLSCDPQEGVGGTMVLIATDLIIGNTYWLVIDGSNGAQCQYTIDFVEGIFEPQIDEELDSGSASPEEVCQGYNSLYMTVGPAITNAHGYEWTLGWNNQTVTSTLP